MGKREAAKAKTFKKPSQKPPEPLLVTPKDMRERLEQVMGAVSEILVASKLPVAIAFYAAHKVKEDEIRIQEVLCGKTIVLKVLGEHLTRKMQTVIEEYDIKQQECGAV